jgi:hypothetical protein
MNTQKDTTIEEFVCNDAKNVVATSPKKQKMKQFSTTLSAELFEKVLELEARGIDRTKLIENLFLRCSDEDYLKAFLFPEQEITTDKNYGQENNLEI